MAARAPKKKNDAKKPKATPKRVGTKKVEHFRTKVANGVTLFLGSSLDGRSLPARRFREVVYSIGSDLGGFDSLSEFQKQLTRRSAALSVMCELDECKLARGEEIDAGRFGSMTNTLNRLAQTLGVTRAVIDATPTLEAYLKAKGGSGTDEEPDGDEGSGEDG